AALEAEWNELLARSASDTVFLTWEWLWSWWEIYGGEVEPCVATVREHGRLVAAAPCMIEDRRRFGLAFRQLAFIGTGLAPVLVGALATERGWDKLALAGVPSTSPVRAPLTAALAAAGLHPRSEAD